MENDLRILVGLGLLALIAARLGRTRLSDNLEFDPA